MASAIRACKRTCLLLFACGLSTSPLLFAQAATSLSTLDARFEVLAGQLLDADIVKRRASTPASDSSFTSDAVVPEQEGFFSPLQRFFSGGHREQRRAEDMARAWLDAKQPFEAAALLTGDPAGQILLAEALLSCGLPDRAEAVLDSFPDDRPSRDADRLRLDLAEWYLRHERLDRANALLVEPPYQDDALQLRRAGLEARILLALQRPAEAATRLREALNSDALELLAVGRTDPLAVHYLRYNLAVALLRGEQPDDSARAMSLLDDIGQLKIDTREARALRDRANLSLGDLLLRGGQGATAREMYQRIQSQGPFSNSALLGLGWASVSGSGAVQARKPLQTKTPIYRDAPDFVLRALRQRDLIGCSEYNRQPHAVARPCEGETQLASSVAGATDEQRRKRALVPWLVLVEQDPDSLAAREAELAIASTLKALGAHQEAAKRYTQVVLTLQRQTEQLQAENQQLRVAGLHLSAAVTEAFAAEIDVESLIGTLPTQRLRDLSQNDDFVSAWTGAVRAYRLVAVSADDTLRSDWLDLSNGYQQLATAIAIAQGEQTLALLRRYHEAALQGLLNLLPAS